MGENNTVVSAYTKYRHLQQYCSHPLVCLILDCLKSEKEKKSQTLISVFVKGRFIESVKERNDKKKLSKFLLFPKYFHKSTDS